MIHDFFHVLVHLLAAGVGSFDDPGHIDIYDGHYLSDDDSASDISCGEEQCAYEDQYDPLSRAELPEFAQAFLAQVASLYWVMRKAVRRYRAAAGKFGPRRRFKGANARRRSTGTGRRPGKSRKGSFV